jgi:hypothetical protein
MDKNMEIISGERKVHHGISRNRLTIDQHLAKEWNDDIGKPMCVYKIKKMIVIMRRSHRISGLEFCDYLEKYQEPVLSNLNQRWLISVCDTIADRSTDDKQRQINGTWISVLFKNTLIHDSFFHHVTDWEYNRNNIVQKLPVTEYENGTVRFANTLPIPGLPGAYSVVNVGSDIVPNMNKRINTILESDPLMQKIYNTLLNQYENSDSIYGLWSTLAHER